MAKTEAKCCFKTTGAYDMSPKANPNEFRQIGVCEDCGSFEFDDNGACLECMLAEDTLDADLENALGINPASYLYA